MQSMQRWQIVLDFGADFPMIREESICASSRNHGVNSHNTTHMSCARHSTYGALASSHISTVTQYVKPLLPLIRSATKVRNTSAA